MGDYAGSTGTTGFDFTVPQFKGPPIWHNGVFQAVVGIRFTEVTDGLSNTLLIGEKYVPPGMEGSPPWDCSTWDGHNVTCSTRAAGPSFPMAVSPEDYNWSFGSRHPGVVQFAFCDGSVHALPKTIDSVTMGLLAQRNDNQPLPPY